MPSFTHTWLPYIYLYGLGGIFFISGMLLVKKAGAIDLTKKRHRYWYRVLIFGFFYFMILHAVWILAAMYL
ncbi:MAG: hypothetical protein K8F60_05590 [Melioribacteraceae bacterium]|nr:hypothetical protein [Ignavibacteriota bacterium]MBZ0181909.1 hypothetical protein [Melioribacteraceae bacterium]|tara:strand:- start:304 stop:516 length:213 start_codon:yes stop_codon:yes gene_type:complete